MGLTLIRKSQGTRRKANAKVALVLAGGAVTGGAFKVGGLKALDDFLVGRKVTDLDSYVGLSAGSLLAVSLAGGITPNEMLKVLEGTSGRFKQLGPNHFYNPNVREFITRPARYLFELGSFLPGLSFDVLRAVPRLPERLNPSVRSFLAEPSVANAEDVMMQLAETVSSRRRVPSPFQAVPAGLFDNRGLERWLRENLARIKMPNEFGAFERKRKRELYITACDLDTAERVVFGADENADLTISEAVQASTALPIFYSPPRLGGVEYVDGGVRHTANIDIAIEKGADLIICYNPFRPFLNRIDHAEGSRYFADGRSLSDRGLWMVLNQVFRTLLHSRLKLGLQRYLADDRFKGDIVLLEPQEQDAEFFGLNPLAFWKRAEAIRHGFESVRRTIDQNYSQLESVFARYGLDLDRDAAKRRARSLRRSRGWRVTDEKTDPDGRPDLRIVRASA